MKFFCIACFSVIVGFVTLACTSAGNAGNAGNTGDA